MSLDVLLALSPFSVTHFIYSEQLYTLSVPYSAPGVTQELAHAKLDKHGCAKGYYHYIATRNTVLRPNLKLCY